MNLTNELMRFGAIFGLSLTGLIATLQTLRLLISWRRPAPASPLPQVATPAFLFDQDALVDASPSGAALIAGAPDAMSEREALISVLARQFPDMRDRIDMLKPGDRVILPATTDPSLRLTLSETHGLTRISLGASDVQTAAQQYEDLERASLMNELNQIRVIVRDTPQLIWTEDDHGKLVWANAAYLSYADRMMPVGDHAGRVWPAERLFADIQPPIPNDPGTFGGRHALQLPGEKAEHWFDITAVPQDGSVNYFAIDANATMRAERAQHEFQQTLGKTFAQLSTGLAIFNRKRQLAMFNPALLDMTALPFAFMSKRPTIDMVLDRLREMRKLPEPKNYATWKDQFTALEAAAKNGTYSERWDMPDGQTFRVTGRPHPDGALAFLFEDISAEVSLTRRFRAEIETGQAVLNALPDAVAVFSPSNTLMMTNSAYDAIWKDATDSQMTVLDLRSALRTWKARTAPTGLWRELEEFGRLRHDRRMISDRLVLTNGRCVDCEVQAIPGGLTLVRFTPATDRADIGRPLPTQTQPRTATG
ncbi:PAS-domain containing protein [Loktanella sp. DJP18]|uniref:PAS-domain containing protein n=1 Tax=Loktanella sp. DJP18 TaxID=3409788 RepID=UPI003BB7239E